MKLRLRSSETKETLKIEVSTPCSIQHLKEIVAQRLTSSSSSAAASVHLSLNRKDEILGSSPQDSLQALGITSGDLIFFTLDPNCFSSEILIVQSNSSQSQNCQNALTLEPSSQKERNLDTQKEETLDSESVKTVTRELDTHKEEKTQGLDTQMDDGGDESMVDVGKSFSVPGFLRKVFWKEVGEGDGGDHKLLVIAVHAVLIESGFVGFDSVSRRKVEGFHLPDEWPSLQFTMSLQYTLPEIIKQGPITINGVETVKLKFQSLGKFVNVYGSLAKNGSGPYGVRLDEDHLDFFLNLIWANCDSIDEMNGKDSFSNFQAAREVFEFWKTVKDKLALPLLIDLCERAGLAPPPCFMRLPTDLKLKILESLCGVDVAKVGSVCSELRYLSSNDDLWKRKFVEQFGNVEGSQGGSHWKEKFAKSWETRKRRKKAMWERPRVRGEPWPFRVGVPRIIRDPHPLRVPRIIGGDHDIGPDFPFGLSLRRNARRNVMPHGSLFGRHT
ncbi:unnamed protein product [Camellia sinensis]